MDNYLLLPYNKELEDKSKELGFTQTYFLEKDLVLSSATTPKELLTQSQKAHNAKKKLIYIPTSPDMLRFAIEKAPVDIILNSEKIYPNDSLHYPKAGLDQVLGPLANKKNKTIAFSFSHILNTTQRPKLLTRMAFNVKICKKYQVPLIWSTFAQSPSDLRSAKDLQAFWEFITTQII